MATTRRKPPAALIQQLLKDPAAFEFFQAVRILEVQAEREGRSSRLGEDEPPDREAVRLRARPSFSFATSELHSIAKPEDGSQPVLDVTFLGFLGTVGVLPQHYTSRVIERLQQKDSSMRDFLDIFHHRTLSLFFRAWCKYRLPVGFERNRLVPPATDDISRLLRAMVGFEGEKLSGRQAVEDEAILYNSGHFQRKARTSAGLEQLLTDSFRVPVRIEPFVGTWLRIPERERCVFPDRRQRGSISVQLGLGATLGNKTWDIQSKIRLHVGPLDIDHYRDLAPGGRKYGAFTALVASYLDPQMEFEVVLALQPGASPGACLGQLEGAPGSQLGRAAWLHAPTSSLSTTAAFPA